MFLALYILSNVLVVFAVTRHLSREGFLLADRGVPPLVAAMSLAVSKFGGGLILAYGSMVYLFGASALWYYAGYTLSYALFFPLAIRLKDEADKNAAYTMADYYKNRTGPEAGKIIAVLCLYVMMGLTCINIVGGAQILSSIADVPYRASVFLVAALIGGYLVAGGFKSVIATDVLQAVIICSAVVLFLFFAHFPENPGFSASIFLSDIQRLEILYLFCLGLMMPFGMPEVWPRIYAVADRKYLKQTLIVTVVTYVALGLCLTFLILGIREGFPAMLPSQAILSGFQSLLPPALGGLMAVFLFAAVMSSADTYLFQANAALEQDLKWLDRFFAGEGRVRLKMRIGIILILILAVTAAILLPDIVKTLLLFTAGSFILGVFGIFSRFTTLSSRSLWLGTAGGIAAIIYALTVGGLSFHVPLYAMAGTPAGTIIGLALRPPY